MNMTALEILSDKTFTLHLLVCINGTEVTGTGENDLGKIAQISVVHICLQVSN